ncbi:MAG: hypothetical protein IJA62_07740 [Ruminococcus sp.]|nr:hypothetical protein [Ruminococcus sp.]
MHIDLKEGLSILYDMEINNFIMTRCIRAHSFRASDKNPAGSIKGSLLLRIKSALQMQAQQRRCLKKQRKALCTKLAQSKQLLNRFYDRMNIDENYRSLIPIGYMLKFLQFGMADKPEGDDGLYCLVLDKLSIEQFDATLEELADKLDFVTYGEGQVYEDLAEAAKRADELMEIAQNSNGNSTQAVGGIYCDLAVSEYIAQRSAREDGFRSFLL